MFIKGKNNIRIVKRDKKEDVIDIKNIYTNISNEISIPLIINCDVIIMSSIKGIDQAQTLYNLLKNRNINTIHVNNLDNVEFILSGSRNLILCGVVNEEVPDCVWKLSKMNKLKIGILTDSIFDLFLSKKVDYKFSLDNIDSVILKKRSNPLVTFVMSTNNRNKPNKTCKNQLKRSIDSVLSQSIPDFEFIIADDASSDGTSDVISEYMLIDKRINSYRFDNPCNGVTTLRYNFLLNMSDGDYIAFIFDDDEWDKDFLKILLDSDSDITHGKTKMMFMSTGESVEIGSPMTIDLFKLGHNRIAGGCMLVKRSAFCKVGLFDESKEFIRVPDLEIWYRMYSHGLSFKFIDKVVYDSYINIDSIGMTYPVDMENLAKKMNDRYLSNALKLNNHHDNT